MEPGRLQITFDCLDPARLGMFWAAALAYPAPDVEGWHNFLRSQGRSEEDLNATFAIEDPAGVRPRMFFQRVPEPKSVKNRVHLDLAAPAAGSSDRAEEIIGGDEATGRDPMWALILDVVVWSVIFGSSRCGRCGGAGVASDRGGAQRTTRRAGASYSGLLTVPPGPGRSASAVR